MFAVLTGCQAVNQANPAICCLVSEGGVNEDRFISVASGESYYVEKASFDTSALHDIPRRLISDDPTSPLVFQFKDRVKSDSFILENHGRTLAVILPESNLVIRGQIEFHPADRLNFTRDSLNRTEMEALGGWGWSPSPKSPIEYCLVEESATEKTRAITDLNDQMVHIHPASFSAKEQIGSSTHGSGTRQIHALEFLKVTDPDVATVPEFLEKFEGRELAVVHEDVAVLFVPIHKHIPGQFLLKGVSEADYLQWQKEWRNWR